MQSDWAIVMRSPSLYEVELWKARLEEEGIPAVIINKRDSAYPTFGDIELYTKRDFVLKASHLIKNNR